MTEEEANQMVRQADTNGDGQIDYEEFVKIMVLEDADDNVDGKIDYDEFANLMMPVSCYVHARYVCNILCIPVPTSPQP